MYLNDYELIYLINDEDEIALEILNRKYIAYIYDEALYFYNKYGLKNVEGASFNDLIAIGKVTLVNCTKTFNEERNVLFYTFFSVCLLKDFQNYRRGFFAKKNRLLTFYDPVEYEIADSLTLTSPFSSKITLERVIESFINELEGEERKVFELRYNGFKYKEIAQLLEITSDRVGKIFRKVKNRLKNKLKKEEI